MKTNALIRSILFSAILFLVACQASSNTASTAVPTATQAPVKTEVPPIAQPTSTAIQAPTATKIETTPGQIAYAHLEAISEGIGPRVTGSEAEAKTAQYIILKFEKLGYVSELRPFSVTIKGKVIHSANVIAVKPGASIHEIIVGAHYDSVGVGKGADDNASGVAVILEVAERLRDQETPYTIRFILFGAEEIEMQGSDTYASQMTNDEIKNTIAMINLDSLTAGDIAYIYGDEGKKGVLRDWTLDFARNQGLTLQTQPGENRKYPAGTTGDWSDFVAFKNAGIPYAYFESTNWSLGDKDGYTQVDPQYGVNGEIWHTQYDTLEYLNTTFPGRVQERLNLYVTLLEAMLTKFEVTK